MPIRMRGPHRDLACQVVAKQGGGSVQEADLDVERKNCQSRRPNDGRHLHAGYLSLHVSLSVIMADRIYFS